MQAIRVSILCLLLFAGIEPVQARLEFPRHLPGDVRTYTRVVVLNSGIRVFIEQVLRQSTVNRSNRRVALELEALTPDGIPTNIGPFPSPTWGGSGDDVAVDAAVDPSGNVWVVGNTNSDDFRLKNPIFSTKAVYGQVAFVMEFNPAMDTVLFASYIGGPGPNQNCGLNVPCATSATALALDSNGNAYIGGTTNDPSFPTTADSFNSTPPAGGTWPYTYSYLVKISPAGRLIYSGILGTGGVACSGGSNCIGRTGWASVGGIAADSSGAPVVAETRSNSPARISRVAPDGSKLLWSKSVSSYVATIKIAQNAAGDVFLFGVYGSQGYLMYEPAVGLFTAKLTSDGSTVLYFTDLGEGSGAAQGIALDSAGNAYLAGTSFSPQFPTIEGVPRLGTDFVLRLDATGTKPQKLFSFPRGVVMQPPRIDPADRLMLLGARGGLLTLPVTYNFDSPMVVGFANSASFDLNTGMTPGTLVSLFGYNLTSSQGTQVTVDGIAAPVIYSSATQINIIVPFNSRSGYELVQLELRQPFPTFYASVPPLFSVGIFTTDGTHAAALNQDGSVNSASNPAAAGSFLSIFGTGAVWPPHLRNAGSLATKAESLDESLNAFQAGNGTTPALISYLGAAPGLYIGVFQMNVQVYPPGYLNILKLDIGIAPNTIGIISASNLVRVHVK